MRTYCGPLVAAGLLLVAGAARADFVPEIPGLEELPLDARSAALGGAGIAASEETSSLLLNPANVALVRRSETTASFVYQRRELSNRIFDTQRSADLNTGEIASAGFVYPVPVYRGAFAMGLVFNRRSLFDRDLVRVGFHPDGALEREVLEERGSIDQWTVGAGMQVSPSAFFGVSATLVTGGLQRFNTFTYTPPAGGGAAYVFEGDEDTDLSGLRASIGGLYFPSRTTRVGFRVDLPYTISYEGVQDVPTDDARYTIDDEVSYPITAGAGAAARLGNFMLTADAEFAPYTLLELNGERLRTEDRIEGYRDVVILRAGVEYTLPMPVRLRAGYRYDPSPYRLLLAEVRDQNPVDAIMEAASFERERHVFTGGVGILMEGALNIDAAVEWIHGEKAGTNVDEENDIARVHVTTSYRF